MIDKLTKQYNKLPFKVRRLNSVMFAGTAILLGYVVVLPIKILWNTCKGSVSIYKKHKEFVDEGLEDYKVNFKHDSEFWKL